MLSQLHENWIHRRRIVRLAQKVADRIDVNSKVLDVGCGDGSLAVLLQKLRPDVSISGIDTQPRANCAIDVKAFDGEHIASGDASFQAVLLIDVLHHAAQSEALLRECLRVSPACVIIKDHLCQGLFARPTLQWMDNVSNLKHGVACPGYYRTPHEWNSMFVRLNSFSTDYEQRLKLYPFPLNVWFERDLHFIARLQRRDS